MLKIYFDWNCITHSKDKYPFILDVAKERGEFLIFPFSNAHIRDVMVSHEDGNKYFQEDIKLLENICGKHFLQYENGQMLPKCASPNEVIEVMGSELETLQKTEFISPDIYSSIKDAFKGQLPPHVYRDIQGAKPEYVISKIDKYIALNSPYRDLESILNSEMVKDTLDKKKIMSIFAKCNFGSSIDQKQNPLFMENTTHIAKLRDTEFRFKTMCLALDMLGFRPEKKFKNIMNIDADASHIFYAGHCDIFVTADSKLRGKAEAMYKKYNFQTQILHPKDFKSFIEQELPKEYSFKYISEVIDSYGVPSIENENAHYKLLQTQIFGMFNVCHKIDGFWGYEGNETAGLFRYCFNNTPYLFYTELKHFCDFIESLLSPPEKEEFRKCYSAKIMSGNKEDTANAKFTINCDELDMKIELMSDSESPIPLPMMLFVHGDSFGKRYDSFISTQCQSARP